ncbi:4-hydroxythreonine-4-phosphate dehydrogenase PdxA [Sulfitobacter sp. M57]|uniref:4-hydroxythreonine-4-phosphate dehydrogenase PdxA n=1 Tax=unclassified Sulfitobacter TaxID=196795 RepID=UPI0023E21D3C|nr:MULTISPECIES: 4-hydroxythreonine-4-phosphate dehydrogenase PdxA [unclassified Sulfitobacter]MDF3413889.1 4-hydroxythreonine-4-phosphate dehydrogenase PdxA [Sulfitobacter sp. KE5]MDF3420830.1 4-hydroxythreonine-4-phosphate dehydrogenase PdxA [Sulfitobacter sp. KE43]MDF3432435.1 4-hydroxythreonine-4-phosphate dehydrogenase PdxA [Sulfitobacter sp. KE42]MDF3458074.1 4-hydroxythreonine-4-phosphate dehydrogenase PdxA [Sulfitobacter sp. S74]MDF3461975.1 4-hydroxythreonine-4-phosphate dehydrogenase
MSQPRLPVAISCGEPAGIGPEVAAGAWSALADEVPMVWLGDPAHLPEDTPHRVVSDPKDAAEISPNALPVLAQDFSTPRQPGTPDPAHAPHVINMIARGVALVQEGQALALCTAPIHKKALKDGAGFAHPGHTEYLAALAGVENVVMMLACEQLRVVPATIHIALDQVPQQLTPHALRQVIETTHAGLRDRFGIAAPRLAIAGLNPHAGEGGTMGTQERDWINELVTQMQGEGYALSGPLPADTMFHAAARVRYDAAVCMYHDQALIPIKTLDFDKGVNVTLGLPFIRTSPDHGTAFDIAGKGLANPTSMIEAIRLAYRMGTTG